MDWNKAEEENKTLGFIKGKQQERQQKEAQRTKARARANRAPLKSNTAELQEALWNIGAFNGLKDRHGRNVVFDTAVDGMRGNVTNQAIENARKMGYSIDIPTGKVFKAPKTHGHTKIKKDYQSIDDYYWSLNRNQRKAFDMNEGKWLENMNTYGHTPEYRAEFDRDKAFTNDSGFTTYSSRLGNLGLVATGDGTYRLYDKDGKLVDKCAQTVNSLQQMLKKHQNTIGNAWDSHGMYGETMLVNGYKYLPKIGKYNNTIHKLQNTLASAAVQTQLNNLDLQTGDVVGLYSMNSAHNNEAWDQGTYNRSNSHEGIVFRAGKDRNQTYIIHNINGKIYVDPMKKFLVSESGLNLDWAPTYVMRPNKKPETTNTQEQSPLTYKMSKDGKNFYDVLTAAGKEKYGLDVKSGKTYALVNGKPTEI